jgi:hypothetical protein
MYHWKNRTKPKIWFFHQIIDTTFVEWGADAKQHHSQNGVPLLANKQKAVPVML